MQCANNHKIAAKSKFCSECGIPTSSDDSLSVSWADAQNRVINQTYFGLLASVFLGAIGGVAALVMGRRAQTSVRNSEGRLAGYRAAVATQILGALSIVSSILILIAVASSGSTSLAHTSSGSVSLSITDDLYGTTCSNVLNNYPDFNSALPVRIYSGSGTLLATSSYDSGTDFQLPAKSGRNVNVCEYSANLSKVDSSQQSYVIADNGDNYANGISCSRSDVRNDACGMSRGYDNY